MKILSKFKSNVSLRWWLKTLLTTWNELGARCSVDFENKFCVRFFFFVFRFNVEIRWHIQQFSIEIAINSGGGGIFNSPTTHKHIFRQTQTVLYKHISYFFECIHSNRYIDECPIPLNFSIYIFIWWFLVLAHVRGSTSKTGLYFARWRVNSKYKIHTHNKYIEKMNMILHLQIFPLNGVTCAIMPSSKQIQSTYTRTSTYTQTPIYTWKSDKYISAAVASGNRKHWNWMPNTMADGYLVGAWTNTVPQLFDGRFSFTSEIHIL